MVHNLGIRSRLIGVGLLLGVAGAANAQNVWFGGTIDFLGVVGSSIQYSTTGSGGSFSGNQQAGFMEWRPVGSPATSLAGAGYHGGTDFWAICGELVTLRDPQTVDLYLTGTGATAPAINAAGAVVADNFLAALSSGNLVKYSAFQAAVWATRYGGTGGIVDNGGTIDVGTFSVRNAGGVGGGNWATFKSSMMTYYNASFNTGFTNRALFLDGLPQNQSQDQFTVEGRTPPVPEPFTLALGVASLAVAARRRFRKA